MQFNIDKHVIDIRTSSLRTAIMTVVSEDGTQKTVYLNAIQLAAENHNP
jgi:hypothetical protein